jgi:hypothetical protein
LPRRGPRSTAVAVAAQNNLGWHCTASAAMTKDELDYSRKLMDETNAILAGLDKATIQDAINWGDLGCRSVEKVESVAGNATSIEWRVLIEEASPDAYRFRMSVAEELARRGYLFVSVATEW